MFYSKEDIKAHIQPKILAALETAARERHPNGFRINTFEFEKFMEIIKIERIRSNENCCSSMSPHAHKVDLSVQANFEIGVFPPEVIIGGVAGAAVGAVGGTTGGVATGAAIGSIVPVAGTIIGGFIGGIVGGISGLFAGAGVGVGAVSGIKMIGTKYREDLIFVPISEVFAKFEEYSSDKTHNICRCVLTAPTQCRSGDKGPDIERYYSTNSKC